MVCDEDLAANDQEALPARRLAETAFDACAVGEEGGVTWDGNVVMRLWSTARIRKRPGMTRAELAEVEAGMLLSARNECSVRELVDIHKRCSDHQKPRMLPSSRPPSTPPPSPVLPSTDFAHVSHSCSVMQGANAKLAREHA